MYKILFISSWKSAGALATPKGITFYSKTPPLGVIKAAAPELRRLGPPTRNQSVCPFWSRKMSLIYALDILMYSCRFCS